MKGRNGILGRNYTVRLVVSPSSGTRPVVYVPVDVFDKGALLSTMTNGKCVTRKPGSLLLSNLHHSDPVEGMSVRQW